MRLGRDERREARDELWEQARYYERQHAGLGFDFLDAVDAAIVAIEQFPDAWRPSSAWDGEPVVRVKQVDGFPVGIVYLVDDETLVIFAYAHHRREPNYWLDRR